MTITKTIARTLTNGDYLIATVELRENHPTLSDGFSVTGDLWEARCNARGITRFNQGREQDAGGCLHDDILKAFPKLAPLIAVHLASPNGVPMHGEANGWYFYSGDARRWEESRSNESWHNREGLTDRQRAARALNIPTDDVPEGMSKDEFYAFVESLAPRWSDQARVARELLESLPN
jgi:hypothetical protein